MLVYHNVLRPRRWHIDRSLVAKPFVDKCRTPGCHRENDDDLNGVDISHMSASAGSFGKGRPYKRRGSFYNDLNLYNKDNLQCKNVSIELGKQMLNSVRKCDTYHEMCCSACVVGRRFWTSTVDCHSQMWVL
jgi:hypothetical protein